MFKTVRHIIASLKLCVTFHHTPVFLRRRSVIPYQFTNWRTAPCRLSANAYSTYSQLPFASGGRL